ncbi:hypothetical protein [Corallococcus macrosporus]|uniref:Uncharacterized protein n=1 Tax=Corallococcus macrosporus DSM 14697 TaxID=1189310 RepID=A0A250JYN8_9BACT|nr:hypothetical protein [Corallococcus macrosporus]ATB48607.1 hypothetical protein MYMAC_004234 [Corallococcus macrosporus DSM 14697]
MSADYTPTPPDPGQLPGGRIALVAGAWMALVVVSLLANRWLEDHSRPWAPAGPSPVMGRAELADVNQRPFALDDRARRLREAQQARLEGYGWVDRDGGVIHLPLERAVERVLAEEGRGP